MRLRSIVGSKGQRRDRLLLAAVSASIGLSSTTTDAANKYWGSATTNGTWNTTISNWSTSDGGAAATTYSNSPADDAFFKNAAGGTITLAAGLTPASTTVDSSGNYTFQTQGLGGGVLTKSGAGILTLSAANTFAGLTINQGSVYVKNASAAGAATITVGSTSVGGAAGFYVSNSAPLTIANNINFTPNALGSLGIGTKYPAVSGNGATFTGDIDLGGNTVAFYADRSSGIGFSNTSDITGAAGSNIDLIYNVEAPNDPTVPIALGSSANVATINNSGTITNSAASNFDSPAAAGSGRSVTIYDTIGSNVTGLTQHNNNLNLIVNGTVNANSVVGTTLLNKSKTIAGADGTGDRTIFINGGVAATSGKLIFDARTSSAAIANSIVLQTADIANTGTITNQGTGTSGVLVSANITGTSNLIQNSSTSALTLGGTNSYTGPTTITAGTLAISNTGSLANTAIDVAAAGTLKVSTTSAGTRNIGSTATLGAGATLNLASGSTFSMNDGVVGTTNLQQEATFSGAGLTVNAANFNLDIIAASADKIAVTKAASVSGANKINLLTGATVTAGTYNLITAPSGLTGSFVFGPTGAVTQTVAVGTKSYLLTLNNSNVAESVTVATGVTITGLTWTGKSNGNGAASTSWDTLSTNNNFAIGSTAINYANANAVTFQDGNPVSLTNVTTPASVVIQTSGVTPASTTFSNTTAVAYTVSNAAGGVIGIAGSGSLVKSGNGIVTLSGVNTFSGLTNVTGGTLAYGITNALGTGAVTVSGATLAMGAFSDSVGTVTLDSSGSITGSSGAALTSTGSLELKSGAVSVVLAGAVPLNKTTDNLVLLSKANTYSGATSITAGTLQYGVSNVLGAGDLTVDGSTAILNMIGSSDTVGTVTLDGGGAITGSGSGTLTSTGTFEMKSGSVSAILGGTDIALNKTTANTVTLSAANTFTGNTTISAGTLALGSGGSFANSPIITVGDTGSSGAVLDLTAKASSFTFGSAQALKGIGTVNIGSGKSVINNGTLAPGNSIGTLNVTGDYTFGSTSTYTVETDATTSDKIAITGAATIQSGAAISFTGTTGAGKYVLATAASGLGSPTFAGTAPTDYRLIYSATELDLQHKSTIALSTTTPANTNAHVGDSVGINVSVANSAPTSSSDLSYTLAGALTGSGTRVAQAGAGSAITNSFSAVAGVTTLTTTASDTNATNSSQSVSYDVTGYNYAAASTISDVSFGTVLTDGSALSQPLTISNTAALGSFTEKLNGSFSGSTGNANTNGGSFSLLAAGGPATTSLGVSIDRSVAGAKSGTATVALVSDGTGTSGLANTSLPSQTINVTATVLDAANASFAASNTDSTSVDIGTFSLGSGTHTGGFNIYNLLATAGYTASLDLLSITPTANSVDSGTYAGALTMDLDDESDINSLAAGGSPAAFLASLNTSNLGTFSETYDLSFRSAGFTDTPQTLTLTITGNVVGVPEPTSVAVLALGGLGVFASRRRRKI